MQLDVRIVVPGLPIHFPDPFAVPLGGSETAGLQLAKAMVALGHRATVFCNVVQPFAWRGVSLMPIDLFPQMGSMLNCDLLLVQRNPSYFGLRNSAKVAMLWVHDLMQGRKLPELTGAMHAVDRILAVSEWQRDQYLKIATDLLPEDFLVGRNGVDLELVSETLDNTKVSRDPKRIVYASRPERGLQVLLEQILPKIMAEEPDASLHIAYYDVPNPTIEPYYDYLRRTAAAFGDRVVWHEGLAKPDLYRLYASSGLYLYPTPAPVDPSFAETSCISVMEAMACGLPWLSSNRGALAETVGKAGHLIDLGTAAHAGEGDIPDQFAKAALDIMRAPGLAEAMIDQGRERARFFGWQAVASTVASTTVEIAANACRNRYALARHFLQRQDIAAARMVVDQAADEDGLDPQLAEVRDYLDQRYAHTKSAEALAKFYDSTVGPGNGHVAASLMEAPRERFKDQVFSRYQVLRNLIAQQSLHLREGKPIRILDWGCSQGECSVVFANSFPGSYVLGVDASSDEIGRARQLADKFADAPKSVEFATGHELQIVPPEVKGRWFEVAVMSEVLEHVYDPVAVITKLERMVTPGGLVVISVPFGPWETQQPDTNPKQHIREFEMADLQDLLRGKAGLVIDQQVSGVCPVTGLALGNSFVAYQADHKPLGSIDWTRKLSLQRPRQTVSVCMMVGGPASHHTLHWCLDSVRPFADEIVVADCGMTEEARRIADSHGAKRFPHASPLEVGFEVPRNAALDRCVMDWVLMIDADERLISSTSLWRYLRENALHTYAIRQCHFSVDAVWPPDMPGRLFRRRPERATGKTMRFWGMLHEHAELEVNQGCGASLALPDVALAHVGYLDNLTRMHRFQRNLPLLQRDFVAYPNRKLMRLIVMRDTMIQARALLAGTYQRPPDAFGAAAGLPDVSQLCTDVVRTFEEFFLDEEGTMATTASEFYHEACKLLGSQLMADVRVLIARDGVGQMSPQAQPFASVEHIQRRAKAVLAAGVSNVARPNW